MAEFDDDGLLGAERVHVTGDAGWNDDAAYRKIMFGAWAVVPTPNRAKPTRHPPRPDMVAANGVGDGMTVTDRDDGRDDGGVSAEWPADDGPEA